MGCVYTLRGIGNELHLHTWKYMWDSILAVLGVERQSRCMYMHNQRQLTQVYVYVYNENMYIYRRSIALLHQQNNHV